MPVVTKALADRIAVRIMKTGAFKSDAVLSAVNTFFGFGFEPSYLAQHDEERIAEHVHGYLCALVAPPRADGRCGFSFAMEHATYAFYICRHEDLSLVSTEARIEAYLERHLADHSRAVSVRTYTSKTAPDRGTDGSLVVLYSIERSAFTPLPPPLTPATLTKKDWSIETLASERFAAIRGERSLGRYQRLFDILKESFDAVGYTVEPADADTLALQIAFTPDRASYFTPLSVVMSTTLGPNAVITKKFLETFRNGLQVYSFYVRGAERSALEKVGSVMSMMPNRKLLAPVTDLFVRKLLSADETLYATVLVMFAFYFTPAPQTDDFTGLLKTLEHDDAGKRKLRNLRDELFRELMSEEFICTVLVRHVEIFRALYADFAAGTTEGSIGKLRETVLQRVSNHTERDVLLTFAKFNAAVRRTNFFKVGSSAVAFRLDPSAFIEGLGFPRVPYAIYMIVGPHFRGFHVRFADIARGGIRIIHSRGETPADVARTYKRNKSYLFQENYNLAYTQMLKNKDIPESGSKGTILVSPRAAADPKSLYMQYIDSLLDLMIPNVPGVRDTLAKEEILFMGPDEGTAGDYPSTAALYAKKRGYTHWKSFTTGKSPAQGGVPHDVYGMTTRGIRAYANGLYAKLGLDEAKLTKFMTGGPDGDLGSNEILMGRERIVAICDGFASVHDPNGINADELVRLAKGRLSLKHFDKTKLSPRGFHVGVDEHNRTLPDGSVVPNGTQFRNSFHFTPYADADVMVPCGGRPASITLDNVSRMLRDSPNVTADVMMAGKVSLPASKLRFRHIVEGANLFITHEARLALENCGVHLFKDSSTNKGGVTSSSLEVLIGLALTDAEHAEFMCVPPTAKPPAFYMRQVDEISKRIEANAKKEFECIWSESQSGYLGGSKTLISDALSVKINTIKTFVQTSSMHHDTVLFKYVIHQYLLPSTLTKVPIDDVMRRVPEAYLIAIFAIYIASHFVYETGLDKANEFSFFQFMHELHAKSRAAAAGTPTARL